MPAIDEQVHDYLRGKNAFLAVLWWSAHHIQVGPLRGPNPNAGNEEVSMLIHKMARGLTGKTHVPPSS